MMTTVKNVRNKPVQDRSTDTVDVILEATTQVLNNPRRASITTNHIAQHAGVSIGSLYRYFNNKQGILALVVQREAARRESHVNQLIADWSGHDGTDLIRQIAGFGVDSFHGRRWVRRSLHKHLEDKDSLARDLHAMRFRVLRRLETKLVVEHPDVYRVLSDEEAHSMLGAWIGCINAVVMYSGHDIDVDALKNQLVNLVNGYLRKSDIHPG